MKIERQPRSWTVKLPLTVQLSYRKDFSLNLNKYRNAHFRDLSKSKIVFTELVKKRIKKAKIPKLKKIYIVYTVYPKTKRKVDVANICSVVDKYFSDTLVECKIIEDDNYTILRKVTYRYGKVDNTNPRVDATIYQQGSEKNMLIKLQATLTTDDISKALAEYIQKKIPDADVDSIKFNGLPVEVTATLNSGTHEGKSENRTPQTAPERRTPPRPTLSPEKAPKPPAPAAEAKKSDSPSESIFKKEPMEKNEDASPFANLVKAKSLDEPKEKKAAPPKKEAEVESIFSGTSVMKEDEPEEEDEDEEIDDDGEDEFEENGNAEDEADEESTSIFARLK